MVICQGCGQKVEIPEGYGRNKIQCPGCGVICPIPAGTETAAPRKQRKAEPAPAPGWGDPFGPSVEEKEAPRKQRSAEPAPGWGDPSGPSVEEDAARWLKESDPAPPKEESEPRFEKPAPPREEPPVEAPARKPKELLFPCRRCGRMIRRQRECPACDGVTEEPLAAGAAALPAMGLGSHALELDEPTGEPANDPDEDDSPYLLAEKQRPTCPKCRREMEHGATLCTSCGFNLQTRKKASRTYDPIARSWVTDLSLTKRLMLVGAGQVLHIVLATISSSVLGTDIWAFFISWPLFIGVLCFVLGTYDTIQLTRDTRGRVKITIVWRFFFVPTMPQVTDVRGFEGVVTGPWMDAGFWEWFVALSLLPLGIIPSIIWWYVAIFRETYHVALAQDHGHAAVYVYRGHSQEQMLDIEYAICSASGLRNVN
jgi:hypothetical protein